MAIDPSLRRILDDERERTGFALGVLRVIGSGIWLLMTVAAGDPDGDIGERVLWAQRSIIAAYFAFAILTAFVSDRIPVYRRYRYWAVPFIDVPAVMIAQFSATEMVAPHDPLLTAAVTYFTLAIVLLLIMPAPSGTRGIANATAAGMVAVFMIARSLAHPELPRIWLVNTVIVCGLAALVAVTIARRPERVARKFAEEQKLRRYFTPAVADRIVAGGLRGEKREVTVLFADLRGFTNLSERLEAEQVVATLNEWFTAAVPVVFENGGTLDKFLGDGLMAYFGAPIDQPDHASRGVRCALALSSALASVNEARTARGDPPIALGIGVHTGAAVVGEIGAPARLEFTAVGDAVNTASRIEGLTKELHTPILVSQATRDAAGPSFAWTPLGTVPIRGREEPVALFKPS